MNAYGKLLTARWRPGRPLTYARFLLDIRTGTSRDGNGRKQLLLVPTCWNSTQDIHNAVSHGALSNGSLSNGSFNYGVDLKGALVRPF